MLCSCLSPELFIADHTIDADQPVAWPYAILVWFAVALRFLNGHSCFRRALHSLRFFWWAIARFLTSFSKRYYGLAMFRFYANLILFLKNHFEWFMIVGALLSSSFVWEMSASGCLQVIYSIFIRLTEKSSFASGFLERHIRFGL